MKGKRVADVVREIEDFRKKLEERREDEISNYCSKNGLDPSSASQYASAATTIRTTPPLTMEESAILSKLNNSLLLAGNHVMSAGLQAREYGYNDLETEITEAEKKSIYGIWKSLERAVKRTLNDPLETARNQWSEIERETKETKKEALEASRGTVIPIAAMHVAHTIEFIDRDYLRCKKSKGSSCGINANRELYDFINTLSRMPGVNRNEMQNAIFLLKGFSERMQYKKFRKLVIKEIAKMFPGFENRVPDFQDID